MAQLDNNVLQDRIELNAVDSHTYGLDAQVFNYFRNTEYFNKIEEGRTWFGYQLHPRLFYQVNPHLKLQAGVFVRHDFGGLNPYTSIQPTFTLKTSYRNFSMLFGSLEGALSHRLIEPLFDINSAIEKRIENGFQLKYEKENMFWDTWINWEKFIEPNSAFKEQFTAGTHFNAAVYRNKTWTLKPIVQFITTHRGGQVDTSHELFTMQLNGSLGCSIEKKFDSENKLGMEGYYLLYHETSASGLWPKTNGNAWYLNASFKRKNLELMFSYWAGEDFIAPRGTTLYQSQSLADPSHYQRNRELLFVRLLYSKTIFNKLQLGARLEPYYDFVYGQAEYSYSFYLSYKQPFEF